MVALVENNCDAIAELLAQCYEPLKVPYRVQKLRAHHNSESREDELRADRVPPSELTVFSSVIPGADAPG